MPVGELFLSAFLQVLFDRLASRELLQFLNQERLYKKIEKWEKTLETIQAVLSDAEEKQLTNPAVKRWLDDLQDLALDVEDILDEFTIEAAERKLKMEEQEDSRFRKLVPASFSNWSLGAVKFSIHMRSKVKHVTSRFAELCKLRHDLGLTVITGGGTSSDAAPLRPPSSSHRTERAVYGRDEDKKKILKMVLKSEPTDANFLIIPIVGMGGVGKTTLAREVYHTVAESFDVKAWVCVSSSDFDVTRISKLIFENITGSSSSLNDLSTVQNELKQRVSGKRFLLVLDDVWSSDYNKWEILQSPFMACALGSRMIVTTRLEDVALKLRPSGTHRLDLLQHEDCWLVFTMCAFEHGAIPAHRNMEPIREKVIEKSKGLPLAAKTLGGLLRSRRLDEWMKILNNKLWDLSEKDQSGIPAALKLSYYHLPSYLKRCFSYCAVFPKDYEFEKEEVVLLWIAEGLVQQSTENEQLEDLGDEYFNDLLSRSMFQQSSINNGYKFVMHDLVHDLAQWASGCISLRLDGVSAANPQPRVLEKVRHFSYTSNFWDREETFAIFQKVEDLTTRIRTFLPIFPKDVNCSFLTNSIPSDLLPKLIRLRVLSLQSYCIIELPISIGGLKYLRYLNLSRTQIRSLPESTSLLYNLQILMLRECSQLVKLPSNFKYLIKLRYLDIKGANLIKEMPSEMKELKTLQKLSNFIVGKSTGSNLRDLQGLKMLHGELCISGLDNVIDYNRRVLILSDMKNLKDLVLEWGSQLDESRSEVVEENVLRMLQPHENLEKLTITCYGGTKFPSWVGSASYSNIMVLKLTRCEKCTSIPPLAVLVSLKDLTIEGMKGLTCIGSEFYGNSHPKPFGSLEVLCFKDLQEWVDWKPIEENEFGDAFPCLRELSIINCPELSGRLPSRLSVLEKLVIRYCKWLVVSLSSMPKLCELEIRGCKRITCDNPVDFKSLKHLTLSNISEFSNQLMQECFGKAELQQIKYDGSEQQIKCCNALTSLSEGMKHNDACLETSQISDCDSEAFVVRDRLSSSPERLEVSDGVESCTSSLLEYLSVSYCPSLNFSSISQLPATLKYLYFHSCPQLTTLPQNVQLPASLKALSFSSCPQLTTIAERFHNTNLSSLKIRNCEKLNVLPNGLCSLISLTYLEISKCPSISSFHPEDDFPTNLTYLILEECVTVYKPLVEWGLHNLTSLTSLEITGCLDVELFPQQELKMLLPPSLTHLTIKSFPKLKHLWSQNLNSLQILSIRNCPDLTSLAEQGLPSSLENLKIISCPKLSCFPEHGLPSSLRFLNIDSCPNITCFPKQGLPSSLQVLLINRCPKLKEEYERNKGREWSMISNNLEVNIDGRTSVNFI